MYRPYRMGRPALVALMAAAALATGAISSNHAYAHFGACRSDPIVTLSNGAQFQIESDFTVDASQIANVAYTLHGPKGTTVISVQFDNGPLQESFTYFADRSADSNEYTDTAQAQMASDSSKETDVQVFTNGSLNGLAVTVTAHGHAHDRLQSKVDLESEKH